MTEHSELSQLISHTAEHISTSLPIIANPDWNSDVAEETTTAPIDVTKLSAEDVAGFIDHTLLKPLATQTQIETLCEEARQYGFASVCVNATWVPNCAKLLQNSEAKVCTVIGFPLGATLTEVKAFEVQKAIELGAQEVDMVINLGRLKDRAYDKIYTDVFAVVEMAHPHNVVVKVILETELLNEEEKVAACLLCKVVGADFVKTATGFNGGGATTSDVALMRRVVGPKMGVKAAGGVRTGEDARQMIAAGATRIGASAGVEIVLNIQGQGTDMHAVKKLTKSQVNEGEY